MNTRWCCFLRLRIAYCGVFGTVMSLIFAFSTNSTLAQELKPIADDSLGTESSVVTPINTQVDTINGGAIRGTNLFHSFSQFHIGEGRGAYFTNPSGIENILSRVTGSDTSKIFGKLGVLGNANLFLINPNGIIFGRNASLNVGGSFVASTANALQFGKLGFFSATDKNIPSPLLTINPSALLFNQINQNAVIQNNSVAAAGIDPAGLNAFGLRVPDGRSLLLVGGNVSMDRGRLNANGGRVELGGLTQAGTVALDVDGDNLSLIFPSNVARSEVSLTNRSGVFVTGAGGGNIAINARNLEILGGSILSGGIGQRLGTPETVAGDITLNATGEIKVAGGSIVLNQVRLGSQGNGGNIIIDSGSFSLQDGAQLSALTRGQGNAGDVTVRATDAVSLAGATISSTVGASGVGNGGNIDINAAKVSLIDTASLDASTRGQGNAGNVTLRATDAVSLAGATIFSTVTASGVGNGGNIDINAAKVSLIDTASLNALTRGQGNAGNVTVRATDVVSLADAKIFSTVEAGGIGKGGNIDINAATLSLIDGAQLQTATRRASATQPAGRGDAGNVNVNVTGIVDITGKKDDLASGIHSLVGMGTVGNGGNITIDSGSFSLRDGAQLSALTRGQGNAGDVTVRATDAVSLAGATIFSTVTASGVGNGGNIDINAAKVSLIESAELSASTAGQGNAGNVTLRALDSIYLADNAFIFSTVEAGGVGKGGNINVNAATLSLIDGAQLQTSTRGGSNTRLPGRGDAGNVNVNVTGVVDITGEKNGFASGIRSQVGMGTVGNGGNITIDSGSFSLRDGAAISALTLGQGNAGTIKVNAAANVTISGSSSNFNSGLFVNSRSLTGTAGDIIVTSPRVTLNNSGRLNAQSASGNGGDINLQTDLLLLRRGAQISTTAGTDQAGGNGGNIKIDAPNGFIVAGASENSDITANAFSGSGGRITINATGIYGIAPLSRQELERLSPDFDPRQLPTNDITAISQTNPSLSGTIELITPDVDPNRGLVQLPTNLVDASQQIATGCTPRNGQTSSFVATGRGGLPLSPNEPLRSRAVITQWVTLDEQTGNHTDREAKPLASSKHSASSENQPIVEANGCVVDKEGNIHLVAQVPNATSSFQTTTASCRTAS